MWTIQPLTTHFLLFRKKQNKHNLSESETCEGIKMKKTNAPPSEQFQRCPKKNLDNREKIDTPNTKTGLPTL